MSTELATSKERAKELAKEGELIEDVLQRSRKMNEDYEKASSFVSRVLTAHRKYAALRDEAEENWATRAKGFDEGTIVLVRTIDRVWFVVFRHASHAVQQVADLGYETADCKEVRRIYAEMLEIERMDYGMMPAHIESIGREALAEPDVRDFLAGPEVE